MLCNHNHNLIILVKDDQTRLILDHVTSQLLNGPVCSRLTCNYLHGVSLIIKEVDSKPGVGAS